MMKPWLAEYPTGVLENINPDIYSCLGDLVKNSVDQFGKLTAFSNFNVNLTYHDLWKKSEKLAAYFQSIGLKKGDRLAILSPNLLSYPIVLVAALRMGIIVVNLNPLYTSYELKHYLVDSGASAIVVLENFAYKLTSILNETAVKKIIITRIGDLLGPIKGRLYNFAVKYIKKGIPEYQFENAIFFKDILKMSLPYQSVILHNSDVAFIQYTGGTTGKAKGAVLTHRNMIANIMQCLTWLGTQFHEGREQILAALPFYHIFALTVCCFCFLPKGVESVLVTNPRDIQSFFTIFRKKKISIFIGINTLFNHLLNHKNFGRNKLPHLKVTVAGGMATQQAIAEKWKAKMGVPIIEGYGLTEASPVVTVNPLTLKEFNHSIGLPLPSTNVEIRDNGNILAPENIGELFVYGPQVMNGYWNNPEETANALTADGWLRTGDLGKMDANGYFYIVDRKKDLIIVSGFNVYPSEVEDVLMMHPDILEAAVIAVPNEETGEAVKAYIVKKNKKLTEAEIIEHCKKYLTRYKLPHIIEFRDQLPKSNVGKILHRELRELNRQKSDDLV